MQPIIQVREDDKGQMLAEIDAMVGKVMNIIDAQSLVTCKIESFETEIAKRKSRKSPRNQASLFAAHAQTNYGRLTTEQLKQTLEKLRFQYSNLSSEGSELASKIIAAKRKYHKTFPGHPSSVLYT